MRLLLALLFLACPAAAETVALDGRSYRIDLRSTGDAATLQMTTLVGPLLLDGNGLWDARQGLRFNGSASAEEAQRAQLAPLLGMLGRREGARTILKIGA